MAEVMTESPGTALITGANGGLGFELVTRFAMAGYNVVGTVRSEEKADELQSRLPEGISVATAILDLDNVGEIADWTKSYLAEYGTPSVLVNNAGTTTGDGLLAGRKPNIMASLFATNYFGPLELTRSLLGKMRKLPESNVLTISSVSGYIANPGQAPYGASKAAMDRSMLVAEKEYAGDVKPEDGGLAVVSLAPGAIRTDMFMRLPEAARNHILDHTYTGLPIEPGLVASAGLFLVLNGTTGQVVHMNDGLFEPKGNPEHVVLDDVQVNNQEALEVYENELWGQVH